MSEIKLFHQDRILPHTWTVVYDQHETLGGNSREGGGWTPYYPGTYRYTKVYGVYTDEADAKKSLAKLQKNTFTATLNHRILCPSAPAPTYLTLEAAERDAIFEPETFYSARCPICDANAVEGWGGEGTHSDISTAHERMSEHLHYEHGLPHADEHDDENDPED